MEPSSALGIDLDPNILAGMFILAFCIVNLSKDAVPFISILRKTVDVQIKAVYPEVPVVGSQWADANCTK